MGCVFAKSCNLPDGVINHKNPAGFVPVEKLADYGLWAVLGTGAAMGTVGLLIPNTSISPDSAFYTNDQYAMLDAGRTRVRVNVKTLPDGSVNAYGFYSDLSHIVKTTTYIIDPRYREPVYQVVGKWLKGVFPISTGLVISGLGQPQWLMEVDVIAVIPDDWQAK